MRTLKRRDFLQTGSLALGGAFLTSRLAFARTGTSKSRFVFIVMRGALDPKVTRVHETYHVPVSNTAAALALFDNVPGGGR